MKPYKRYAKYVPSKLDYIALSDIGRACEQTQREACELTGSCLLKLGASEKYAVGNVPIWRKKRFKKCRKVMVIIGEYPYMNELLETEQLALQKEMDELNGKKED